MTRWLFLISLISVQGCATRYVYEGRLDALDSSGDPASFLIYWSKTDRRFWFDTASGSVKLLTACSTNAVNFDETGDGQVIFRRREKDRGVNGELPLSGVCGRLLEVEKVTQIAEGILSMTINCKPVTDAWNATNNAYLMAQPEPYQFTVTRKATDIIPKAPPCEARQ